MLRIDAHTFACVSGTSFGREVVPLHGRINVCDSSIRQYIHVPCLFRNVDLNEYSISRIRQTDLV